MNRHRFSVEFSRWLIVGISFCYLGCDSLTKNFAHDFFYEKELQENGLIPYHSLPKKLEKQFLKKTSARWVQYKDLIEKLENDFGVPKDILIAVVFQESKWDPKARSHTGVTGIMQVTQSTAEQMGITDRSDPTQSLYAGAKYLRWLHQQVSKWAPDDQSWIFTLAAYNSGLGHLQDARQIATLRGGSPSRWQDVRSAYLAIAKGHYDGSLKHGPWRGFETVQFTENVRGFQALARQLL